MSQQYDNQVLSTLSCSFVYFLFSSNCIPPSGCFKSFLTAPKCGIRSPGFSIFLILFSENNLIGDLRSCFHQPQQSESPLPNICASSLNHFLFPLQREGDTPLPSVVLLYTFSPTPLYSLYTLM